MAHADAAPPNYHTSLDHSPRIRHLTSRLDYLSILLPLLSTTLSATHFGLARHPLLQTLYARLAVILTLLCALTTLHPAFTTPSAHPLRTTLYSCLGLASFAPIAHGIALHGVQEQDARMGLWSYLAMGVCHALGAAVYALKWPERGRAATWDVCGSSHQIMHVAVVAGAVCGAVGVLGAYWGRTW
ncbi:hemolysin-iii channel protein [Stagonosporopsis vannaccii]|nr:hemolysin-iii channel protein [Stagonosporopsis vannaccii]